MDVALESLKEVIVLLRSSEIGNSGAISAKLPPSRFECDCFQIAADLPNLAHAGAVFKVVLKAPPRCRERLLGVQNHISPKLPQQECSPQRAGADGKNRWLRSWAGEKSRKRQEGSSQKLEIAVMTGDTRGFKGCRG